MRIIAGEKRGRVIEAPEGLDTRPTTDRVRESIMSSIFSLTGGYEGLYVLDAFSGSGAMGLESLSRGADFAVLNDISKVARGVIQQNADNIGYDRERVKVLSQDILASGLPRSSRPFNLIFLDPPYKTPAADIAKILANAFDHGTIDSGCIVVYESGKPLSDDEKDAFPFDVVQEKKYGKTYVTYLRAN